jgi:adenosyl cobinamide kinase/adenosyl cobinamide phosphate guanylyltransferase
MITLVLGGARSGKSELAERIAGAGGAPVTYVATAIVGDDDDFARRVRLHRDRRPSGWRTVEAGAALSECLADLEGTALVDSLGTWVAATPNFEADAAALCAVLRRRVGETVVVSEEVGMGVHPSTDVGGRFRDVLGGVNRAVSEVADEAFLVVAGRALRLGEALGVEPPAAGGEWPADPGASPADQGHSPADRGHSPADRGHPPAPRGVSPAKGA